MRYLLLHLLDERGAFRLAFDLAIALGTLAVAVAWGADAVRALWRRQAAPVVEPHDARTAA